MPSLACVSCVKEALDRAVGRREVGGRERDAVGDGAGEGELRFGGDGSHEGVAVAEMPVRGVRRHARRARRLPERHGARAAGAGELQPLRDERTSEVAVMIGARCDHCAAPLGCVRCEHSM